MSFPEITENGSVLKYQTGQDAQLGDRIRVAGDSTGVVVCSIDSNEYTPEFPREQWSYLGAGVMIQFANYGLVHYTETDEDLEFLGRADQAHKLSVKSVPLDVEAVLESLTEPQLVQLLVRYAYQLTMLGRGTYVPGGDDLKDPKLMRLINETVHRALDHADACLSGRTPRRPIPALYAVLFAHDSEAMKRIATFAFENAYKNLGDRRL